MKASVAVVFGYGCLVLLITIGGNNVEAADKKTVVDDKCEIIANHTINGVEYQQCSDGRLLKAPVNPSILKTTTTTTPASSDSKDVTGDNDIFFGKHFGKQLEVREKMQSLQDALAKKHKDGKSVGRKFGTIYSHHGFDEGSRHVIDEEDEGDDEEEEEDEMIKASPEENTETTTTKKPEKDLDFKEMIARAHHKPYRHPTASTPTTAPIHFEKWHQAPDDDESTPTPIHFQPWHQVPDDVYRPHDAPLHYGNLKYLDFAPTHPPQPAKNKKLYPSESLTAFKNKPFLVATTTMEPTTTTKKQKNVMVLVPSGEKVYRNQNEIMFREIQKIITSYDKPPELVTESHGILEPAFSLTRNQIILAFAAPVTAFLFYCVIVFIYAYRRRSAANRRLIPKSSHYQNFGQDDEAAVGFAV